MEVPTEPPAAGWVLDDIDRGIISALQADGRKPFSKLAKDLDISESGVRYRMRRLQDAGVLQVVGIANPLRTGFDVMALLGMNVEAGAMRRVCDDLAGLPETSYVATTAGAFDIFVEVICRDTAHFTEVLTNSVRSMQGVFSAQTFFVLEIHKMAYGWGVGPRHPPGERTPREGRQPSSRPIVRNDDRRAPRHHDTRTPGRA